MKIKNLKDVIKNFDDRVIGTMDIDIDSIITQVASNVGSIESLLKGLTKLKESADEYTFGKIYERAIFAGVEKKEPKSFLDTLELAQKVRENKDTFTIEELGTIQTRVCKLDIKELKIEESNLVIALAINNINSEEKDKKKE